MKTRIILGVGVAAAMGILVLVAARDHGVHRKLENSPPPIAAISNKPAALKAYVSAHAASKDPKVQDTVGAARIRLAYDSAHKRDYKKARAILLETAHEYKGTGAMNADYGGISDEATYQAAVCLVADGRKSEAAAEFRQFLRERPLSPLVTACYRRLVRLNNGKSLAADERLLEADDNKQAEVVRIDREACGPKVVSYLLPKLGKPTLDYRAIAKICGTGTSGTKTAGTTVAQLRKGFKCLGVQSFAYRLDRRDLDKAPMPAVLLVTDHYLALLAVHGDKATIYDPLTDSTRTAKLPPIDDSSYSADLIVFSQPELHS